MTCMAIVHEVHFHEEMKERYRTDIEGQLSEGEIN